MCDSVGLGTSHGSDDLTRLRLTAGAARHTIEPLLGGSGMGGRGMESERAGA